MSAGTYKVVGIGCGAGAVCPAFVDGRGGRPVRAGFVGMHDFCAGRGAGL